MSVNKNYAAKIYSHLINGKVLVREIIQNDNLINNYLFSEVMDNLKAYEDQYAMCGFNFINTGDYVYISDKQPPNDRKTDVGRKAQILLLMVGKYLNSRNLSLTKFSTLSAGITQEELEEIQSIGDNADILVRAGMGNGFLSSFKSNLVERNIVLEKTSSKTYVLSAIGKQFFEELKDLYCVDESIII